MNNIQYQKIGLCIAGTKSRQGGFTPFVITGILAGNEDSNMDRVTLVPEKPVYVIKHTNEYILYLLIDRKVKPCDRDTFGVLSIALTIARDMQLANGKSPYTLLKEVYDKFRNNYMKSDGNECDRFINKDVNPADFVAIMEQYPLEKRSSDDYISMNPLGLSGKLRVPQEKMEDLFRDTQYREFAQFKEIEFGVNCQTTLGLENIEIPRPIVYAIVLGDNRIKKTLSRPDDCFDTASVLKNTLDIKYDNISFCLKDLLNSPEHQIQFGQSSVMLDMDGRCIRCKIHKEEIKYLLEYRLEGGTEKDQQTVANGIVLGKIRLLMGENPLSFYSISPRTTKIPASWTRKNAIITPNYEGALKFNVIKPYVNDGKRIVIVTIQITQNIKDTFIDTSNQHGNLNYPISRSEKEKVKDIYKKKSESELKNYDDNCSPKKKNNRWIVLGICCLVSMCIGAGIVGAAWWFGRNQSYDESLQIARDKIKTVPFEKIISLNEADTLTTLRSFREAMEEKLRSRIKAEFAQQKAAEEKVAEEKVAEEKVAEEKAAEEKAAEETNKARKAILSVINETHDIIKCRKQNNWNKLSNEDKLAVEAVLNLDQYKGTVKKSIENLLKSKKTYQTWDDVERTHKEILKIIDKNNVK